MPINYLQIQPQLSQYALDAKRHQIIQQEKLTTALALLHQCASTQDSAREKIRTQLDGFNPKPRCGIPTQGKVDQGYEPEKTDLDFLIAASDGSQIVPNPHDEITLGLVNASLVTYIRNNPQKPTVAVKSRFILDEEGRIEFTRLSEDLVNLNRDIEELNILSDIPLTKGLPAIAIGDGPLELFHQPQRGVELGAAFQKYQDMMRELIDHEVILAGYIDKPRAGLIAQMLAAHNPSAPDLSGLADTAIFNQILKPGYRSAVFELSSPSSASYTGSIQLFFFFLNVGSQAFPWTVRVEIPAAVTTQPKKLNLLHTALLEQCQIMGNRPYPYILHRAHEEAKVSMQEKENLTRQIAILLYEGGVEKPGKSHKQDAKDLASRKRME